MSKYVVTAECEFLSVEFKTNDIAEAKAQFKSLMESSCNFYDINLYDGETGEVYAYYNVVKDPCGKSITIWVAD